MDKTPFAGLTRLAPSDPLSEDAFSFQQENPTILDALLRLAVQAHRHDAHAALPSPTADPTVVTLNTGGTIPADTAITVGYTLIDADGGETALNTDPQLVTTQGGLETPDDGPTIVEDHAAGTLVAATYSYAVTVTDGLGGETLLGPSSDETIEPGNPLNRLTLSGLTQIVTDAGGTGWRLWRSINGDRWGLLATGALATDGFVDDGSTACDCTAQPPTTGTGNTNATSRLSVTVPSPQNGAAVSFRIYASLDGEFATPSVLGTYPVADLDVAKIFTTLTTMTEGSPPDVSRAYQGANKITFADIDNPTADVVFTTASLANGAVEQSVKNIGLLSAILKVTADRACRVTMYATAAAATADAARPITTPPTGNHGVILDVELAAGILALMITPAVIAANLEDTDEGIAVRVTNLSGATSTVQVTVKRRKIV